MSRGQALWALIVLGLIAFIVLMVSACSPTPPPLPSAESIQADCEASWGVGSDQAARCQLQRMVQLTEDEWKRRDRGAGLR